MVSIRACNTRQRRQKERKKANHSCEANKAYEEVKAAKTRDVLPDGMHQLAVG